MLFSAEQWEYIQKGYHLTGRQVQIAKAVCDGLEITRIAKKYNIAYDTARTHIRNIGRKVAARGRAELILRLIQITKNAH